MTDTGIHARTARTRDLAWQWSKFDELTPRDLYEIVRLREAVFIVEQNCPYPDADGRDPRAWHLLGWVDEVKERKLVAYARLFEAGIRYQECSIGRVVTAPDVRGGGFGRALMAEGLRRLESLAPRQTIKIAAQLLAGPSLPSPHRSASAVSGLPEQRVVQSAFRRVT